MKKENIMQSLKIIVLVLVLSIGATCVSAIWQVPAGNPPSNNTDVVPIIGPTVNIFGEMTDPQIKPGSLTFNDGFIVAGPSILNDQLFIDPPGPFVAGSQPLCADPSTGKIIYCSQNNAGFQSN